MKLTIALLTGSILTIVTSSAANVIVNGNFEDSVTADTTSPAWGDTAAYADGITGWTISGAAFGMANGDGFGGDTAGGAHLAGNASTNLVAASGSTFVTSTNNGTAVLSQTIAVGGAGTLSLSYNLGSISFGGAARTAQVQVFDGVDNTAASLYDVTTDIQGLAGNAVWNTISSTSDFSNTGSDVFVQVTLVDGAGSSNLALDTISLDYTAVPEPSSAALLGLGGLALILRRRK